MYRKQADSSHLGWDPFEVDPAAAGGDTLFRALPRQNKASALCGRMRDSDNDRSSSSSSSSGLDVALALCHNL